MRTDRLIESGAWQANQCLHGLFLILAAISLAGFSRIARSTDTIWLSSLDLHCVQQGWGQPRADCALDGQTISINGRLFTNGLATHAHSTLYVTVNGNAERFTALVGVEDALGQNRYGTVQFAVIGDSRLLWHSGIVRAGDSAVPSVSARPRPAGH